MEVGTALGLCALVTHTPPGRKQPPCILGNEGIAMLAMSGGDYGFSGEAVAALRLGPCGLDRPPAFFANTVEYHRRKSLHHKVGFARVQGRGTGD